MLDEVVVVVVVVGTGVVVGLVFESVMQRVTPSNERQLYCSGLTYPYWVKCSGEVPYMV